LAGNVWHLLGAWIATSLALHRLLLFYPERPKAVAAARKKFVTARLGDVALAAAAFLLVRAFGTADIGAMLAAAAEPAFAGGAGVTAACVLIAVAALLKSAQFPTHGWLIEVMETPTPVSALLHAGIVNAGGFLVLRFADVVVNSPAALMLLMAVGAVTAVFGCLVMLCQTSAKVSLAYSTVAQMGFMLLQCGLGAFPVALVHIVAHSLYKAHAFLSAGGAAESAPQGRMLANATTGARSLWPVLAVPLVTGGLLATVFAGQPAIIALGMIIAAGIAQMLATSLAAGSAAFWRAGAAALAIAVAWGAIHSGAYALFGPSLAPLPDMGAAHLALTALAVIAFISAAALQAAAPQLAASGRWQSVRYALANGLYAHTLFDRALAALSPKTGVKA
jgi:NAD(P)H-quinone oxidoreductase subunit 5